MQRIVSILFLITLALVLQGCTDIAITGAQVIYNRRTLEKNFKDQYITREVYQALYQHSEDFRNTNIVIATYHREVLLAGQAQTAWQRIRAGEIVKKISGVTAVYNLITLDSPSSTMTRMSDAWLTGKVKAKLIASDEVDATHIKVVTENGIVYLMGIVTPEEANEAAELARSTEGVRCVVKIFSYIRITKK